MRIERRFTKDGQSPYAEIEFRLTTSEIRNPDGSTVFKADNVEVPATWRQVASDVLAQKYFQMYFWASINFIKCYVFSG